MANIWRTRARKPLAHGKPTCSYGQGKSNEPDLYGIRVPNENKGDIYIHLTEFELRDLIEEWKRCAVGFNAFIHTLPNVKL